MENNLYKSRSIYGCIKAAFNLMNINILKIFKKTWMPAVALAIIFTLYVLGCKDIMFANLSGQQLSYWILLIFVILVICQTLAESWLMSGTYTLLNTSSFKSNLKKSLYASLTKIFIGAIIFAIVFYIGGTSIAIFVSKHIYSPEKAMIIATAIELVIAIIGYMFTLPFLFSITKYIMEKDSKFANIFGKDYHIGIRHIGFILIGQIITILCYILIMLVIALPLMIIFQSYISNQTGMMNGDPDGTPSYFTFLLVTVSLLTTFLYTYIFVYFYTFCYYIYGAITQQEKEKADIKMKIDKYE
jgi:MFS family permease